jgi:hypothetical protein
MEAMVQGHMRFATELRAAGKMVVGERLRPDGDMIASAPSDSKSLLAPEPTGTSHSLNLPAGLNSGAVEVYTVLRHGTSVKNGNTAKITAGPVSDMRGRTLRCRQSARGLADSARMPPRNARDDGVRRAPSRSDQDAAPPGSGGTGPGLCPE